VNGARVAGVVVDHNSGPVLAECVRSLLDEGVTDLVVIENGDHSGALRQLAAAGLEVPVIHSGRNLGYGAGANRGVAATVYDAPVADYVLVCNPDLNVHRGAVASMVHALAANPAWAVVGPRILTPQGEPYPSVRPFPSILDAAGHAVVGLVKEDNPFTRRYRPAPPSTEGLTAADWVSGACFMARRQAFEEVGGFDERYFMFAEDMDLCYRLHQAGWGVGFQPDATVTHVQGVSTRRHPYRMLLAHHRSALRFSARTTTGWRRLLLPAAALILGARLVAAVSAEALGRLGTPKD
jgi:N-acetylglucosaminyl-diphospho-decaprenol L-rhamnosyltransferase